MEPDHTPPESIAGTDVAPAAPPPARTAEFEDLVRDALEQQVLQHWRTSPRRAAALLMASGDVLPLLWGSVQRSRLPTKLSLAVGAIVLLRLLVALGIRGPWAVLFLAGSAAGAGTLYYRQREALADLSARFRVCLDEIRQVHEETVRGHAEGHYSLEQRDLMLDGLLQRLLRKLDDVHV